VPQQPARRSSGITTRAAVLALVLCAVVVALAYPVREYVAQRAQIASLRAQERAQQAAVAELRKQATRWDDPAYIRAQARERLHFVEPGETAYVVLTPPTPKPVVTVPQPSGEVTISASGGSWFDRLWGTVEVAGRPAKAVKTAKPAPQRSPSR
jgi:cell division protein FtsB